jgi:ABC-type antimicrobial peptide transport system permease subunit
MAAITSFLRAEVRLRWRAWVFIALLIAAAGGVVLTTAAGARRTASAYNRFLESSHAADVLVSPDDTGVPHFYRSLQTSTGATVVPLIGYGVAPVRRPDEPILVVASPDARFGDRIDRPKVTDGRLPHRSDPSEVLVDTTAARLLGVHVGDHLSLRVAHRDEELPSPTDDVVTVRVVGVGVTRDNVVPVNALASAPTVLASTAFTHRFGPDHYAFDGADVLLPAGESKTEFSAATQKLARQFPETGGNVQIADEAEQAAKVNHAIRPEAVALAVFSALTLLTALFAIGQLLARHLFMASSDNGVLRALGMSRWQLVVTELAQVAATATVGAIGAVVLAVAASPLMPIGPARTAEPHVGFSVDWTVLGAGFAGVVLVFVALMAWPAWRYAGRTEQSQQEATGTRASRLRRWVTAAGAPPAMSIGVGHAVETGRGRTAAPTRTAIAVTALAVTAIVAAVTFGTNLSRLVRTPRLYGQSWDVTIDAQFSPLPTAQMDALLPTLHGVTAWTYGTHSDLTVNREIVPAIALVASPHGMVAPTVVAGRAASGPHEVALGSKSLARLHRHVGQTFTATVPSPGTETPPAQHWRIVGQSVFPFFGEGSFTPTGLGTGAQITEPMSRGGDATPITVVLIRVRSGRTHQNDVSRVVTAFTHGHICSAANQCSISTNSRPTDVLNYSRIRHTPLVLAAVLALLALGVLGNLLATSIRRRGRDFAILKTLGVGRRGVAAAVAWQATALIGLALLIGLPAGVLVGRAVWGTFATGVGIPSQPETPMLALAITVPIALCVANLIAAAPGYVAAQTPPAQVLRTE